MKKVLLSFLLLPIFLFSASSASADWPVSGTVTQVNDNTVQIDNIGSGWTGCSGFWYTQLYATSDPATVLAGGTLGNGLTGSSCTTISDTSIQVAFTDPVSFSFTPNTYFIFSAKDNNYDNAYNTNNFNISASEVVIKASPSGGNKTVGSPFTVNVAVNAGEEFNAARATVAVSENLTVNSISNPTSNACNLHYTTTPTTSNPSFAGAIFGDSAENCNVYSMVITPNEEGTGTVTFTNGSVKSYADNSEILTGVQNASFTIVDGPTATPTPDLGFTIASVLPTYNATYPLTGTKLTSITSIFVNGEDTNSTYPTSTSWENIVDLSLGENNFTIYGSDGSNQTASQTVTVERHTLGDINGDGEIDLIDASLFAVDWDKTEDLTYNLSDMNDDGVVDLTDLSILAKLQ
ncbi:MAG: dockerin type I domain-containing protein [Patescibacteria group bacterium]